MPDHQSSLKNKHKIINLKNVKEHNLKGVSISIPKNELVVITGVSGSGKSSLAFDTIYAEGRRRYMNSLSSYTRYFEMQNKPDVESITGLSPTIAIEQKNTTKNPRSTVATITEIYDYLRVLYAGIGIPYSPSTGKRISKHTIAEIINKICNLPPKTKVRFTVPTISGEKSDYRQIIIQLRKQGCTHIIADGVMYSMDDLPPLEHENHIIEGFLKIITIAHTIECRQEVISQVYKGMNIGNDVIYVDVMMDEEIVENEIIKAFGDMRYEVFDDKKRFVFSEKYCCPTSDFQIDEIEPQLFSFNSPKGACRACGGVGIEYAFADYLIIPNPTLSINEGVIAPWHDVLSKVSTAARKKAYATSLKHLSEHYEFSLDTPFERLPEKIQMIILHGSREELIDFGDNKRNALRPFEGIIPMLEAELQKATTTYITEALRQYQANQDCSKCGGTRLRMEALAVKIDGYNIGELCRMTISEMYDWFRSLYEKLTPPHLQVANKIIKQIEIRLSFLMEIGVKYLTLNRRSATLSGGEMQRIKIATQLGCGLEGIIYVLDEPSIGLHQSDNDKLLNVMRNLRDMGNTVIVVEHDEDTIRAADYLIDVGPGAGSKGGEIVAHGKPQEVIKDPKSLTGQYLSGKIAIKIPEKRRPFDPERCVEVLGAFSHNLKNIDVKVPLGCFVAITGASGSGKSTFAIHTLCKALKSKGKDNEAKYGKINGMEYIDSVIQVDQSPIGRTPRSNPITYINAFTMIRECFVSQPEAKNLGLNAGCFSFNVKGGRCEACEGDGAIKVEMHFMPDVYIKCEACNGMRYNREVLQVKYKGKSIYDVLSMTTDEAVELFSDLPLVHDKLLALQKVGLGYLQLGQPATTLSGGETQRVKLAKELSKHSIGHTFYVLDEPTTGLHFHDIDKLLRVLHELVDNGHTVLTIEHNLDVIKSADYVIDFGPYGGNEGGEVVAAGTPEEVAQNERSLTGKYLKRHL